MDLYFAHQKTMKKVRQKIIIFLLKVLFNKMLSYNRDRKSPQCATTVGWNDKIGGLHGDRL